MAPLHLIDGSLYFFRGLYGVPDVFFDPAGRSLNGVKGYLHFLLRYLAEHRVRHVAVAFDESLGTCFRNEIYADYKTNRAPADDNVRFQLGLCRRLTRALGVLTLAHARYEADDILATLTGRARRPVVLLSRDKDLQQLLRPGVEMCDGLGAMSAKRLDAAAFQLREGFHPGLFPDYQALVGDAVDNVPGVPGVGAKTAAKLVARLGGLEGIYGQAHRWQALGVKAGGRVDVNLRSHQQQALLYRRILRLHRRVPLRYGAGALRLGCPSLRGVARTLNRLGLGRSFAGSLQALAEVH